MSEETKRVFTPGQILFNETFGVLRSTERPKKTKTAAVLKRRKKNKQSLVARKTERQRRGAAFRKRKRRRVR